MRLIAGNSFSKTPRALPAGVQGWPPLPFRVLLDSFAHHLLRKRHSPGRSLFNAPTKALRGVTARARQTGVVASFRTIAESLLISAGRRFGAPRELNAHIFTRERGDCQACVKFVLSHRRFLATSHRDW